ncbi:MAG: amylo-alpha-1,6-glucosidase [Phycisphaerae bacterium]
MPPAACPLARCPELSGSVDEVLSREWLITDGQGGFASGSVIGCPTRRYHGLLVGSRRPPLERFCLWAGTLDQVIVGGETVELSTYEFDNAIHPQGHRLLTDFSTHIHGPDPWVQFTYSHPLFEASKRITLFSSGGTVKVTYRISPRGHRPVGLRVSPLIALRDFHGLRRAGEDWPWKTTSQGDAVWFGLGDDADVTLAVIGTGPDVRWRLGPVWWKQFVYRIEQQRGFTEREDLVHAGSFEAAGTGPVECSLVGVAFVETIAAARERYDLAEQRTFHDEPASSGDAVQDRLLAGADQFVVRRALTGHAQGSTTILAGYPWFGDWGRDSFIALEGLLLIPGRYDEARQVLATFAGAQRDGLIPNRFDDYGRDCDYNSVDASLWFIHAADAYLRYSGDRQAWPDLLAEPCRNIVEAFCEGTDFDIKVTDNGLLRCGNLQTQITWMDAKCGDEVFTPRNGWPVEVNALWYHSLCLVKQHFTKADRALAERCSRLMERIDRHFGSTFWNPRADCLYDCIGNDGPDAAIRPNQILAVSLAHSPLDAATKRKVLESVGEHLLTPYGLRSLCPDHFRYVGRYGGGPFERDRAYHNGTVWAWLIGPYVEAFLRVHGTGRGAKRFARRLLGPLIEHLDHAGLNSVSEIFDGDWPHGPRGCPAQAWSVAEVLRAWKLTAE